jgi:flagellar hook-associated protein 3 FlgL
MRVTSLTFSTGLIGQLNNLTLQQSQLQTQVSTGQRIQSIADDPAAVRRVLDLQAAISTTAQYQKNISRLQDTATASYDAINSLSSISNRAGEIATLADGLKTSAQLQNYATEVNDLIKRSVQAANTQSQGAYLFAGTQSGQPPYTITTDADGNVTGVTYQGNSSVPQAEVASGVTVSALVPGENATGSGPIGLITDSRVGADFFNHLISLAANLRAGDTASIATNDRPALANDESNITYQMSANGALQSRLEASATMASGNTASLNKSISNENGVDLADTMVRLNATQTAYQATLQSAGKILGQATLLDFLR